MHYFDTGTFHHLHLKFIDNLFAYTSTLKLEKRERGLTRFCISGVQNIERMQCTEETWGKKRSTGTISVTSQQKTGYTEPETARQRGKESQRKRVEKERQEERVETKMVD